MRRTNLNKALVDPVVQVIMIESSVARSTGISVLGYQTCSDEGGSPIPCGFSRSVVLVNSYKVSRTQVKQSDFQ